MANQLIIGRALDANGYIAPGAKATVYADNTSTLIEVYEDVEGTIAAANPIIADGDGFWPQRYVTQDAKVVVTTSDDVALYTLDPAPLAQGTGASASAISFEPTLDIPQANVQAAIEAAADLAVSGFATFGIGITGNATLLSNIDATGTGAGVYRFDGTSTGTFPTGVSASDTGMIELWRQSGATAMQFLFHATTDRIFHRRMASTTWGTWREVITSNQAPAEGDILYRGASAWTRLAKGAQGQRLVMGASVPEWGSGWIYTAPVTLAGVDDDFTGLPSHVTEVRLFLVGVSLATTTRLSIRLGTSGGFVTSGYLCAVGAIANSTSGSASATTEFQLSLDTAASAANGFATFVKGDGNEWFFSGTTMGGNNDVSMSAGRVSLASSLTQIRLFGDGVDTFDAGTAYIAYR